MTSPMPSPVHVWDATLGFILGLAVMALVWISVERPDLTPVAAPQTNAVWLEVHSVHPSASGGYMLVVEWPVEFPLLETER